MLSRTLIITAVLGACGVDGFAAQEVEMHGFVSLGFLQSTDNNYLGESEKGSFQFNEFGLNFRVEIDDKTSAGIQFFSRDLGALGNNEVLIDWCFLDHSIKDELGVRIGRVKLPGAMYNEYQDIDAVRGTILLPQGVYDLNLRDTQIGIDGVALYGNIATEGMGDWDYNLYYGILPIEASGSVARAFEGAMPGSSGIEDFASELGGCWGGNVTWNTPVDGLRLALAYQDLFDWEITGNAVFLIPSGTPGLSLKAYAPFEFTFDHFTIITGSVEYTYDAWVFSAEYRIYDSAYEGSAGDEEIDERSWYLQASYELNEKWMFTGYYMDYVEDPDDHDDEIEYQRDFTFAARYNFSESWNLKAEVHFIEGYALTNPADGTQDEKNWTLFAVKSTVSF